MKNLDAKQELEKILGFEVDDMYYIIEQEGNNMNMPMTHARYVGTLTACEEHRESYYGMDCWDDSESRPYIEFNKLPIGIVISEYNARTLTDMVVNNKLYSPTEYILRKF